MRWIALIAFFAVFLQANGVMSIFEADDCASDCDEGGPGAPCAPDCENCACCAVPKVLSAPMVVMATIIRITQLAFAGQNEMATFVDPSEILHVPIAQIG